MIRSGPPEPGAAPAEPVPEADRQTDARAGVPRSGFARFWGLAAGMVPQAARHDDEEEPGDRFGAACHDHGRSAGQVAAVSLNGCPADAARGDLRRMHRASVSGEISQHGLDGPASASARATTMSPGRTDIAAAALSFRAAGNQPTRAPSIPAARDASSYRIVSTGNPPPPDAVPGCHTDARPGAIAARPHPFPPAAPPVPSAANPTNVPPIAALRPRPVDDDLCARIARIIYREAGIVLGADNSNMILARVGKRVARAGCDDLDAYVRMLEGPPGAELIPDLVTALTTNVTQFFREAHHFDFLRGVVAPGWSGDIDTPLDIWSAGCSSGQEPYSIAMALSPPALSWADAPPLRILATDIDHAVLARAERGEYSQAEAGSIPPALREAWFHDAAGGVRARPGLRGKVEFRPMNLHGRWDLSGQFDVIFCRNVIIYFDAAAQLLLWEKFLYHLRPGGWLVVGHSEQAPKALQARLRPVGPTVYQSVDPAAARG